jgi:hypothetical protein
MWKLYIVWLGPCRFQSLNLLVREPIHQEYLRGDRSPPQLSYLDIFRNELSDRLSDAWDSWTSITLHSLMIDIFGSTPASFGSLISLDDLSLADNKLTSRFIMLSW